MADLIDDVRARLVEYERGTRWEAPYAEDVSTCLAECDRLRTALAEAEAKIAAVTAQFAEWSERHSESEVAVQVARAERAETQLAAVTAERDEKNAQIGNLLRQNQNILNALHDERDKVREAERQRDDWHQAAHAADERAEISYEAARAAESALARAMEAMPTAGERVCTWRRFVPTSHPTRGKFITCAGWLVRKDPAAVWCMYCGGKIVEVDERASQAETKGGENG